MQASAGHPPLRVCPCTPSSIPHPSPPPHPHTHPHAHTHPYTRTQLPLLPGAVQLRGGQHAARGHVHAGVDERRAAARLQQGPQQPVQAGRRARRRRWQRQGRRSWSGGRRGAAPGGRRQGRQVRALSGARCWRRWQRRRRCKPCGVCTPSSLSPHGFLACVALHARKRRASVVCCHSVSDVSRLPPGSKVVLATGTSLEQGAARELLFAWASDARNAVIFTDLPRVRRQRGVLRTGLQAGCRARAPPAWQHHARQR
jgi:hypothetical protein